jgi:periplasmic divalent cation tolerance protein
MAKDGSEMTESVIIMCTAPSGGAEKMAQALVEEHLAACVNVSQVRSYFMWEGKFCEENEELMIIKTTKAAAPNVEAKILELHSYQLPEIIAIPIVGGDERYLRWIAQSVG